MVATWGMKVEQMTAARGTVSNAATRPEMLLELTLPAAVSMVSLTLKTASLDLFIFKHLLYHTTISISLKSLQVLGNFLI